MAKDIEAKVSVSRNKYYIMIRYNGNNFSSDSNIASILEIPITKYIQILEFNGAIDDEGYNGYFFEDEEQAYMAIRDLDPYILMKKLA